MGRYLFRFRPFVVLGTVSYGLYLFHLPVFFAIQRRGEVAAKL
jgi:peptidoglycan/LPS O-acetylase OafA/YrhL